MRGRRGERRAVRASAAWLAGLVLSTSAVAASASGSVTLVDHGGPTRYGNLADALAVARTGDTLFLADGVYTGPENRDLEVNVPITIIGSGPKSCIIDCGGAARAFWFRQAVHLEGLTIRNGTAEFGGAVRVDGSNGSVTSFTRVHFEWNSAVAGRGGALASVGRDLRLVECAFVGNSAVNGGGGLLIGGFPIAPEPPASLVACRFEGNRAPQGAALATGLMEDLLIDRCKFAENEGGGSVISFSGDFFNVAGSSLIVRNSLVVDNRGVAIVCGLSVTVVMGSTIANNVALGARTAGVDWVYGPGLLVMNSVVWGNRSGELHPHDLQVSAINGPAFLFGSDVEGLAPFETNISVDPLFVDAAAGDYHLSPMSPCIDAGIPFGLAATQLDIDGQPRLIGAGFDIGADEFAF